MKIRSERGNSVVELALFLPVLMMLLIGMYQIAQITYTYYTLRKAVYAAATYLSTQQGVNFCNNPGDPTITAAINFGITGTTDASQPVVVAGLTSDMIVVTPESYDPVAQAATGYDTSGCGAGTTVASPNFIIVSISNSFTVQPVIPFFSTIQPFSLSPQVQVPYGGT
jgi:Flp pilus assembly protein TadG